MCSTCVVVYKVCVLSYILAAHTLIVNYYYLTGGRNILASHKCVHFSLVN